MIRAGAFIWTDKDAAVELAAKALERIAVEVQRSAKQKAPVDTGTLQASITVAQESADTNEVAYTVGTNVFYAPFQEFGTRYIPPHPYLVPALVEVGGKYGTVGQ